MPRFFSLSTTVSTESSPSSKKLLGVIANRRGQGLIEYLIIVALMGVATIAIVRVMGQTVSSRFATISYALRGTKKVVEAEQINEGSFKKKDLGNFFDGVGSNRGEGRGGDD